MILIDADDRTRTSTAVNPPSYSPARDFVEVVRCKDCKWWMPNGMEAPASIPAVGACGYRKGLERLTTGKWYCAYGERKDNDKAQ